jgi:hypothetical protein
MYLAARRRKLHGHLAPWLAGSHTGLGGLCAKLAAVRSRAVRTCRDGTKHISVSRPVLVPCAVH